MLFWMFIESCDLAYRETMGVSQRIWNGFRELCKRGYCVKDKKDIMISKNNGIGLGIEWEEYVNILNW